MEDRALSAVLTVVGVVLAALTPVVLEEMSDSVDFDKELEFRDKGLSSDDIKDLERSYVKNLTAETRALRTEESFRTKRIYVAADDAHVAAANAYLVSFMCPRVDGDEEGYAECVTAQGPHAVICDGAGDVAGKWMSTTLTESQAKAASVADHAGFYVLLVDDAEPSREIHAVMSEGGLYECPSVQH